MMMSDHDEDDYYPLINAQRESKRIAKSEANYRHSFEAGVDKIARLKKQVQNLKKKVKKLEEDAK